MDNKQHVARAFVPLILYLAVSGIVSMLFGRLPEASGRSGPVVLTGISSGIQIPLYLFLRRQWGLQDSGRHNAVGWLLLSSACGSGLSILYGRISEAFQLEKHFSNQAQENLFAAALPVQLVVLCLLVPVCEELLFRGLIFKDLKSAVGEIWAAIIASALFSVFHGNPIQMIYAFPMALAMQLMYHFEGGIEAPVAFHIAANLTSVLSESILR